MAFNCPAEIDSGGSKKIGTIILRYNVPEDENADPTPANITVDPPGIVSVSNDQAKKLFADYKEFRKPIFTVNVLRRVSSSLVKQEDEDCSEPGTILEFTRCSYKRTETIVAGGVRISKREIKEEPIVREVYGDFCTRRIFLFLVDLALELYRSLNNKDKATSKKVALLPSNFRANFEDPDQFASLIGTYQDIMNGVGMVQPEEPVLVPPVITEVAFGNFSRLLASRTTGEVRDIPQLDSLESGSASFNDIAEELVAMDDLEAQDLLQLIGDIQNTRVTAGGVTTDEAWMIEAVDAVENRDPGDWPSLIFAREQDV